MLEVGGVAGAGLAVLALIVVGIDRAGLLQRWTPLQGLAAAAVTVSVLGFLVVIGIMGGDAPGPYPNAEDTPSEGQSTGNNGKPTGNMKAENTKGPVIQGATISGGSQININRGE